MQEAAGSGNQPHSALDSMISARDFVHLPYTPDLTEAGIHYARRVLPRLHSPAGRGLYDTVRRAVAATALQLAFRRHLSAEGISYAVQAAVPFSDPDRYDLDLAGRRCELKSFLISRPLEIDALAADPGLALRAPALVPADRHAAEEVLGDGLYLFALVSGLVAGGRAGTRTATLPGGRTFWIHGMPPSWMRPQTWAPLGPLALKSDSSGTVSLELSGQDGSGTQLDLVVGLPPAQRVEVDASFHALSHLHAHARPDGRIGIHSPSRGETHLIGPGDWQDAWLDGKDICLLGWITLEQFRMRARLIPEGRRVFQFSKTKTRNLAVDVASLKPVHQLLERVRDGTVQRGRHQSEHRSG
ncbi:MAG: hypothetical protein V1755_09285 [Chloroflexota bacterium]